MSSVFKHNLTFVFFIVGVLFSLPTTAQDTFTAIGVGDWNSPSSWSRTPGTDPDGIPDANDDVIIPDGTKINLIQTQACDDLVINFGGLLVFNGFDLTFNAAFSNTVGGTTLFVSDPTPSNSNFNFNGNWIGGTSPTQTGGGTKTVSSPLYIASFFDQGFPDIFSGHVTVANGGSLVLSAATTFSNNLLVEGGITNSAAVTISGDREIGGNGSIDLGANNLVFGANADITIRDNSDLSITAGTLGVNTPISLTNNDGVTINAALDVDTFTAGANAKTITRGTITVTTLDVDATGNLFQFAQTSAISIPVTTYYNLTITASGTVTIGNGVTILGEIEIIGPTTFTGTVTVGGEYDHFAGTVTQSGTIAFNGTGYQRARSFVNSPLPFNNLTVNKASGNLNFASGNVQVSGTLTMTQGTIDLEGDTLELGVSTGTPGTLSYTNGHIIGAFEKWFVSGNPSSIVFPIGTSSSKKNLTIDFASLTTGGSVVAGFTPSAPGTDGLDIEVPSSSGNSIYNTFSEGYWTISSLNGAVIASTYNISADVSGFSSFTKNSNVRLLVKATAGSDWTAGGQSAGSYSADVVSATGVSTLPSVNLAVGSANNCLAVPAGSITGDASVCTSSSETYSVTQQALTGTSTFLWNVVGGTIQTNNGNSIDVLWGATGQVGSVTVSEQASGCGYGASRTKTVTVGSIAPDGIDGREQVAEISTGFTYSIENPLAGYTYNWTISGGTITSGSQGTSVTANWGTSGDGYISATATDDTNSCTVSAATQLDVTIYTVIDTDGAGDWDDDSNGNSRWETGNSPSSSESARINNAIALDLANISVGNLIINSAGSINLNGNTLTVNGELVVNGAITGTGTIILADPNSSFSGNNGGAIGTNVTVQFNTGYTIQSGTVLNINGNISLQNTSTITNNGEVTLSGNLTLTANNSWVQGTGTVASPSKLSVAGTFPTLGTFNAGALYNEVIYSGTTAQTVRTPLNNKYYTLVVANNSVKTFPAALTITGDFRIDGAGTGAVTNFTTNSTRLTFADTVDQVIDLSGMFAATAGSVSDPFYNVTINKPSGTVTLASNTDVANNLTLTSGHIITNTATLTLKNRNPSTALTGGSTASYVDGKLARLTSTSTTGLYSFAVGGDIYRPASISTTTNTGSTFTVETFDAGYGFNSDLAPSLERVSSLSYWEISRTGADEGNVTLNWSDADAEGITEPADLVVAHYNGTLWEDLGNSDAGVGFVTSLAPVTSFSPFAFGSTEASENPLPVELLEFKAVFEEETGVLVSWTTASEQNNEKFELYRSSDASSFELIATIEGAGNSNELVSYSYADTDYYPGFNYYRLKQTDYDGQYEWFDVVMVFADDVNEVSFQIYPNPVTFPATFKIQHTPASNAPLQLFDLSGAYIASLYPSEGTYQLPTSIRPGIYLLKVAMDEKVFTQRLVVK